MENSVVANDNYRAITETLFPPLTTVELPLSVGAGGMRQGTTARRGARNCKALFARVHPTN